MKTENQKAEVVKAEALSAMAGPSMRPSALEAATSPTLVKDVAQRNVTPSKEHVRDRHLTMTTDV
jgi:hypothetical protein